MKRLSVPTLAFTLLAISSLACSIGSTAVDSTEAPPTAARPSPTPPPPATKPPIESERRCGDGVCDGPENSQSCPEDCAAEPLEEVEGAEESEDPQPTKPREEGPTDGEAGPGSDFRILYHLTEHTVTSNQMNGETCYLFNFLRFLDAGHIRLDPTENEILELKDHPTSKVTAKALDTYYYMSSPNDPVAETFGMAMFNWDVEDQTLWAAGFDGGPPQQVMGSSDDRFPGAVGTGPGNAHLVYLETRRPAQEPNQMVGAIAGKMNPFVADSSLLLTAAASGHAERALEEQTNRQLFTSFSDVSPDGRFLYTIARRTDGFEFMRITLDSGKETSFTALFPSFDWQAVDWTEFFPPSDDFSYASFIISPDEKRLIAYKNVFTANLDNPCYSEARHDLWVFDLEANTLDHSEGRRGYVTDGQWRPDSTSFALAIVGNSGCYPDYLDSWIDTFDPKGEKDLTLVEEAESRITTLGWSPDGEQIAYDVYTTDFVGRLKLIEVARRHVHEIVNTQDLGYDVDRSAPVTLLFADWITGAHRP